MKKTANPSQRVLRGDEQTGKGMGNPHRLQTFTHPTMRRENETHREPDEPPSLLAQRDALLSLRARLRGDLNGMADAALKANGNETGGNPQDLADLASDTLDQELTLSLLGNGRDILQQIEDALKRIEEGTYGLCEKCGDEILRARLEVIPYAVRCVECAARLERRQGIRGGR